MTARLDRSEILGRIPRDSRLTPKRIDKQRSAATTGRTHWLCDCRCGGSISVPVGALLSGNTRSCGCLRKAEAGKNLPRRQKVLRAYKLRESIDEPDGTYVSLSRAASFLTCGRSTLRLWANIDGRYGMRGCPWLNGDAIGTRPLVNGRGRQVTYYSLADLIRVAAARKVNPSPAAGLVHVRDAARQLGVDQKTVRGWAAAQLPSVRVVRLLGRTRDGKPFSKAFVPSAFVEEMRAKRKPHADGWMSVRAAAEALDVSRVYVRACIQRGKLVARERQPLLTPQATRTGRRTAAVQKVYAVTRESVEALRRKRLGLPPLPGTSVPAASPSAAADPTIVPGPPTEPRRVGRGRKRGDRLPASVALRKKIADYWRSGEYDTPSDLARALDVSRTYVSKVLRNAGLRR